MDAAVALPPPMGPLSPELVLVSPPEIARLARIHLPLPAARPTTVPPPQAGIVELTAVWLFCLAMTLGPVLFMLAVQ